jgi:hypothetical protein
MIEVKLRPVDGKGLFSIAAVNERLRRMEERVLTDYAQAVVDDARASIKRAVLERNRPVPSQAGETPRSRGPDDPLKRIVFDYEPGSNPLTAKVRIGFERMVTSDPDTLARLEMGGTARAKNGRTIVIKKRPTLVPAQQRQMARMPALFTDSL